MGYSTKIEVDVNLVLEYIQFDEVENGISLVDLEDPSMIRLMVRYDAVKWIDYAISTGNKNDGIRLTAVLINSFLYGKMELVYRYFPKATSDSGFLYSVFYSFFINSFLSDGCIDEKTRVDMCRYIAHFGGMKDVADESLKYLTLGREAYLKLVNYWL